jgi:hypothetical protein
MIVLVLIVALVLWSRTQRALYSISVPPSYINQQFGYLFENGQSSDVSFEVNGEGFAAHKLALELNIWLFFYHVMFRGWLILYVFVISHE